MWSEGNGLREWGVGMAAKPGVRIGEGRDEWPNNSRSGTSPSLSPGLSGLACITRNDGMDTGRH